MSFEDKLARESAQDSKLENDAFEGFADFITEIRLEGVSWKDIQRFIDVLESKEKEKSERLHKLILRPKREKGAYCPTCGNIWDACICDLEATSNVGVTLRTP